MKTLEINGFQDRLFQPLTHPSSTSYERFVAYRCSFAYDSVMDTAPGIYIIRNEDQREFCKIGQTSNIGKRLRALNSCTCHPFKLVLVAFHPLAELSVRLKVEKQLHKIFRPYRHRKEWFKFTTPALVQARKLICVKTETLLERLEAL